MDIIQVSEGGALGGSIYDTDLNKTDLDRAGNIILNAANNQLSLLNDNNAMENIGQSDVLRAKSITYAGTEMIMVWLPVFSAHHIFNSSDVVLFFKPNALGNDAELTFNNETEILAFLAPGFEWSGNSPTLNLNPCNANILQAKMVFTGDPVLKVKVDNKTHQIGNLYFGKNDSSANVSGGAVLDLSTADTFTVEVHGTSPLPEQGNEYSKQILSFNPDHGTFIKPAGGNDDILLLNNDGNTAITWVLDKDTMTISSTTNPQAYVEEVLKAPQSSPAQVSIIQSLVASDQAGSQEARDLLNELIVGEPSNVSGELSTLSISEKIATLVPNNTAGNITDEAESVISHTVITHMDHFIDHDLNKNRAYSLGEGVAAGDDISVRYGIWSTFFSHKARQKQYDAEPGYNVWNNGGTLGFDTMVNNNFSVGFALSHIGSRMKQFDAKFGSKTRTKTNVFSVYGLMDFENEKFVRGIISVGLGNIKFQDVRRVGGFPSKKAHGKYKTKILSGSFEVGKRLYYKEYIFMPSLGFRIANFRDSAYREKGAGIQNLTVSKKSSSIKEAIATVKVIKDYSFGDLIITPEIAARAHVNLDSSRPVAYITSPAFNHIVKLKGERPSRAWYALGMGVNSRRDNIALDLNYEMQIDKKYFGHQGTVKLRLNF